MTRIPPDRLVSRRLLAACLALASMLVGSSTINAQDAEPAGLRAGAATSNTTPALGSSLNGNMRDQLASNVHDETHARCLVLDDGTNRLAIVVVDLCMIPREVVLDAKQQIEAATGIPADHVLISATHTHSAPTCAPVFQSDTVPGYPEFLARRISDGVRRAVNNLEPAEVAWGAGSNDRQVHNRRWHLKPEVTLTNPFGGTDKVRMNPGAGSPDLVKPAGPIDPEVWVLSARSRDGRPIALLANYSLHYVGGTRGGEVSADYFGMFANRVAELLDADRLDPPFVGIMSNGTSGDINNINFREPRAARPPYEQMRLVADELATEAARVAQSLDYRSDLTLDAQTTELQLGVRLPSSEDLERARAIVEAAEGPIMTTLEQIYARESILLSEYPSTVPVTLQALRIGDLSIAAIPCEVFVEIGLQLKQESPFPSIFTISLANGYNGYLPTEAHHELGGYETWRARSSYLEVDAASRITQAVLNLFSTLRSRK
ncbi:neutral/alkaline non-lysosomal ceramidase N-terminal domain-containing protein [Tautonia rosea]|uniref:neutral/alkaline non-lysosomal ceramidase N-terminal domain-containing protein n=1 Tax=Tautonia rosea TaxID=2728037 RepID=UPI0014735EF0|nr:neutral/alkaline non-lysosomal ceramidase N-terminal domain-containing protein [Tautonia rosea]